MVPANSGVPAIPTNSCVSLARFFPALFSVAGTAPYRLDGIAGGGAADGRSRLLLLRLLSQWTQLTGFIARNGAQQKSVADLLSQLSAGDINATERHVRDVTQPVSFGSLLDAVDSAWTLVLDKRIHQPLLAVADQALAQPDYRLLLRPLAYWTFADRVGTAVNDAIGGGHNLAATGCTFDGGWLVGDAACAPQAGVLGLGGNVTVAFKLVPSLVPGSTSTVIDSSQLFVRVVLPTAPGTPWLEVGHKMTSGEVETKTIALTGGFNTGIVNYFVVTRDARRGGYSVSYGPVGFPAAVSTSNLKVGQASSTSTPWTIGGVVRVGASVTNPAQNVKGKLSEVALWDSALSRTEIEALILAYGSGGTKPAWPSEMTLPPPSSPDANEAAVGLPAAMLESLIATQELIEAYVKDGMLASVEACRSGGRDDGLERLKERAARSLRMSYAVEQLAQVLYGRALLGGTLTWATRYDQALAELSGARAKTIQALSAAGACEDPFGLGRSEFPLYYGDTRSLFDSGRPLDLLEASALFLKSLAGSGGATPSGAIGDAAAALAEARNAWTQQYSSAVQEQLTNTSTERLNDLRSSYGRELIDLCGVPVSGNQEAATVVGRFLNANDPAGPLSPQDCFIQKETAGCSGSQSTALGQVDPKCLRGQVGEAWLALQSASARVIRAQLARQAARATHSSWLAHCADKQGSLDLASHIHDELVAFEIKEAQVSRLVGAVKGAAEVVAGYVTENPSLLTGGAADLARSVRDMHDATVERKAALDKLERAIIRRDTLNDCWAQAGLAGIPVAGAEQEIVTAVADMQVASAHAATIHNRLFASVREAGAAIARETGRLRPRIAFHYWAQEKLEIFQRRMARARRMTYLYLRGVEHDLQRNFQLADDVLAASHPEQLNQIALQLSGFLSNGIEKRVPARKHVALSLCNDVLRLPERHGELDCDQPKSAQRFRELVFSPANAMYKEDGTYLGQALPFTLTPELAGRGHPAVFSRCAERLAEVDASFVNDALSLMPVLLAKRETFYSDTCSDHLGEIGPIQEGTLRSSNNLLVEGPAAHFGRDFEWARADINALRFDRPTFIDRDPPGTNAVRDLGGRGLYGDYALIVPPATLNDLVANPGSLKDIQVRFDYVSVADQGVAPPPATRALSISYLDGDGQVLSNLGGNAVSATCTASCADGSVSTLTATTATGWHFGGWTGACTGAATTCTVAMDRSRRVWATFVDDRAFDLTLASAGSGSGIVTSGWPGAGVGPAWTIPSPSLPFVQHLPSQVPVYMTATPNPDSTFVGWSGGGCTGTTNPCVISSAGATGAATVTATFAANPVPPMLTVNRTGVWETWSFVHAGFRSVLFSGPIDTGSQVPCDDYVCKVPFAQGTALNLGLVSPSLVTDTSDQTQNGYFSSLLGPDCATGPSVPWLPNACNVLMNGNRSVTIQSTPGSFFDVIRPTHGGIFADPPMINCASPDTGTNTQVDLWCHGARPVGSVVTLSASPAPGYKLTGWTGAAAACGASPTCSLTLAAPYAHITLSATFGVPPPPQVCTPGTERSCCNCPGGNCAELGVQTCKDNGSGWTVCGGAVCGACVGTCIASPQLTLGTTSLQSQSSR
jgi:hypothetical protein